MAVHLHRAHRSDALADELARLLAEPAGDPFAEEVVAVPARGVERWLTQRLSHRLGTSQGRHDGVCAGVRFTSPRSLLAMLAGIERDDAWDPDRLVWPLLATIDDVAHEPWAAVLARHLGLDGDTLEHEQRRDRRYSLARRLAGLVAGYAVQRPSLLRDWRAGRDTDGRGHDLEPDLRWQPALYRQLLERVAAPPPDVRHSQVLASIRVGEPLALPNRLSLFGHTRMPATEIELLAALGEVREVHLWLPQASARSWDRLAQEAARGPVPRAEDHSATLVRHPLLASLGRDARELQRGLTALGAVTDEVADTLDEVPATSDDEPRGTIAPGAGTGGTLLHWLQDDLRNDVEPDAGIRAGRLLRPDDSSIQVHAAHGPSRQIDVLREVLLGLLADDETLEPRDVLVMCPDIEAYAPLLEAGFGLAEAARGGHPAHTLRVRLADRGLTRTNPLLDLAASVVEIAAGRATASEVLDLIGLDVVRRRFGFSDRDLESVATWVEETNIRWGLAPDLRAPYRIDLPHNTWKLGLDRLLLGVSMAEDGGRLLAHTLPYDDVASAAIERVGRFAELVERLETAVRALHAAVTPTQWLAALTDAVSGLGAVAEDEAWQRAQADRELARVADAVGSLDVPLRLADVRALLRRQLRARPTRANFRTGALTVATMVPMRSVPHRVICLVGLDDGAYPRAAGVDGDDVLSRQPWTGERDVRAEDRQLLLDAVLAATQTLVLTYAGADERTGVLRPPAVPIGELLDALDITAAEPVRQRIVVRHPLQPFDSRNFRVAGPAGTGTIFSFDAAAFAGAVAARSPRHRVTEFLTHALEPLPVGDIELTDLRDLLLAPVKAFVQRRLGISLPYSGSEPRDAIPISLDALQRWDVGDRMLMRVLDGESMEEVELAERARGAIPPSALGGAVLDDIRAKVQPLVRAAATAGRPPPRAVEVDVDVAGRRITGQVADVRGEELLRVGYSRLGPKQRLSSWVDLLMLCAAHPGTAWTARTIGPGAGPGVAIAELGPIDRAAALGVLAELVDLYDRGMSEPLPMPLKTAHAWAQATGDDDARARRARWLWETVTYPGEQEDGYHRLVWGERLPLQVDAGAAPELRRALLADHARDGETWSAQATRLGQLALRLWMPLLSHERGLR